MTPDSGLGGNTDGVRPLCRPTEGEWPEGMTVTGWVNPVALSSMRLASERPQMQKLRMLTLSICRPAGRRLVETAVGRAELPTPASLLCFAADPNGTVSLARLRASTTISINRPPRSGPRWETFRCRNEFRLTTQALTGMFTSCCGSEFPSTYRSGPRPTIRGAFLWAYGEHVTRFPKGWQAYPPENLCTLLVPAYSLVSIERQIIRPW